MKKYAHLAPWLLAGGLLIPLLAMFSFLPALENELQQLDFTFSLRVRIWFVLCRWLLGIDMFIVDGRRTPAEQNKLHQQNPKNPAYNPNKPSSHIDGVGVDVNGYKDGILVLRKSSSPAAWAPVVQLAKLCGLRWGGTFTNYYDANHFDGY